MIDAGSDVATYSDFKMRSPSSTAASDVQRDHHIRNPEPRGHRGGCWWASSEQPMLSAGQVCAVRACRAASELPLWCRYM